MNPLPTIDALLAAGPPAGAPKILDVDDIERTAMEVVARYGGRERDTAVGERADRIAAPDIIAMTFDALMWGLIRRVRDTLVFLAWDRQAWVPDIDGSWVETRFRELAARMACGMAYKNRKMEFVSLGLQPRHWQAGLKTFRNIDRLGVDALELNRKHDVLALHDGTDRAWDLRAGKEVAALPEWLMTRRALKGLTPKAGPMPRFNRFLKAILAEYGDEDRVQVRAFMQRLFGYCCQGDNPFRMITMVYGDGRNGKTTLLSTVMGVLGECAKPMTAGAFLKDPKGGRPNSTTLDAVWGEDCRMMVQEESEGNIDGAALKAHVGGSRMAGRGNYENNRIIKGGAKLFFTANKEPKIVGADRAVADRLVMVMLEARLPKYADESRPYWEVLVEEEGAAILAWMLEGARMVYAEGRLDPPAVLRQATTELMRTADKLRQAVVGALVKEPGASIASEEMYKAVLSSWIEQGNDGREFVPEKGRDLAAKLRAAFDAQRTRGGDRKWLGIRKRRQDDPLDDPADGMRGEVVDLKERRRSPG